MTIEIIRDLWVCQDCLFAFANGDYPDDAERAAAIEAGEVRELPMRWALDGPREAGTDGPDDPGDDEGADQADFSRDECDCCGSRLGGSRHRAALVGERGES